MFFILHVPRKEYIIAALAIFLLQQLL